MAIDAPACDGERVPGTEGTEERGWSKDGAFYSRWCICRLASSLLGEVRERDG